MTDFVGRNKELARLERLKRKNTASLVVIKGRRRIGKSRLLREFGQGITAYFLSGVPPTKETTAESERKEFARQLAREVGIPGISSDNWGELFWHLAQKTQKGRTLIVLDEITWMGSKDQDFLGHLKNTWDLHFSKNPQLILAICGSMSAWIEKNILSSTGFFGRESLTLNLRELPLNVCTHFWEKAHATTSSYEMLKMLAVTGGIPRYLEEIDPFLSTDENLKLLCFEESGILFNEFEKIFSDLFNKRNALYKKIVSLLVSGLKTQGELSHAMGYKSQSEMSEYLEELEKSGFVSRDYTWRIHSGKFSRLSCYRLSDNYSRFYLKYILPNREKILNGNFENVSLTSLQSWSSIMGLQIENLVLSNRQLIKKTIGINPNEIVIDNPYIQRKTKKQAGCQIDYMIQTQQHLLYVFEIKSSRHTIKSEIIHEVKDKINKINLPKHYYCRPILIHTSEVSDELLDRNYFSHIINMQDLLKTSE